MVLVAHVELDGPRGGASHPVEREVVHELVGQDQLRGPLQVLRDADPFDGFERSACPGTRLDGRVHHIHIPNVVDELSRQRAVARPDFGHAEGSRLA